MAAELESKAVRESKSIEILSQVAKILQEIRFGSVELVIHEGRVVQIERREKLRFDSK